MPRTKLLCLMALFSALLCSRPAEAVVKASSPGGFAVETKLEIASQPARVWEALVFSVGEWWSSDHTFFGQASNLSIDPSVPGCFCERTGLKAVRHLSVVYVDPPRVLRLSGGLGPLQEMGLSGSLTIRLAELAGATEAVLTYNVSGFSPGGLESLAAPVDRVLARQLARLKQFVETGGPE